MNARAAARVPRPPPPPSPFGTPPSAAAELLAIAAGAHPSLEEVVSLWPAGQRDRLVLWIGREANGQAHVRARLREHDLDAADLAVDVARQARRIRSDVPVVFELGEGRTQVVPLASLSGAALPR